MKPKGQGLLAILAALPLIPSQTLAAEYALNTGNGLLAACTYQGTEAREVEYQFGVCIGFIKGAANTAAVISTAQGGGDPFCGGPNIDNGQLRDVVVKALRAQPETRDQTPVMTILFALHTAFPCP